MSRKWTKQNIPALNGKTIVITGANSGIGFDAARLLAAKGGHIVFACRSEQKAATAVTLLKNEFPDASTDIIVCDLSSLESIHQFADGFNGRYEKLDILINNAGVMAIPQSHTKDGFEMQFGTNHLGHFALTGLLLDRLLAAEKSRVVTVSSNAHRTGKIAFDNLQSEKRYQRWLTYCNSKLANLLFAFELNRRLQAIQADTISVGVHPGYAATNLQHVEGAMLQNLFMKLTNMLFAQSSEMGALPTVFAAVAEEVNGCDFIGPDGFNNMRGHPTKEKALDAAYHLEDAQQLWRVSQTLTGVTYLTTNLHEG